ncbi:hypothetical protein BDV95DRAFT_588471 [Massariosphaeria phaeospora]|uniref:Zn(2)-C6 fungal-type domain-containing protein n=1 Tax=Massariosphaeria phaeospora TaxID=100035 RepID=A0A7C8MAT7_9PLEO|nr:hypothetical protein BDV95DRAFT_588471 [Massariosphaeria phaeospora]
MPIYSVPRLKACDNCAKAKIKCDPDTSWTKCKRCCIQGLECVLREPVQRKRRKLYPEAESMSVAQVSVIGGTSAFSLQELMRGIEYYHGSLAAYFPFMALSSTQQACSEFVEEKPFLCKVLAMLGCTPNRERRRELAVQCRQHLTTHALQVGTKSLDLLQGLLVMIYWYHYQNELPMQRIVYIHLCMSMVVDLGLSKSPFQRTRLKKPSDTANGYEVDMEGVVNHNLEEKRALLGCFFISSLAMNMDAMRFSEYMEDCTEDLEKSQLPSDQELARMVRLRQLFEEFEAARRSLAQERRRRAAFVLPEVTSPVHFVGFWEERIDEYWRHVPEASKTDFLRSKYDHIRLCLFEICLEESMFDSTLERLVILQKCLTTVKSQLEQYLFSDCFGPPTMLVLPHHYFHESNHAMYVAIQLWLLKCEGWSRQQVQHDLNLVKVIETATQWVERLREFMPYQAIPEFFILMQPVGYAIKKWYDARLQKLEEEESVLSQMDPPGQAENEVEFESFWGQFMNPDDSVWLQSLLDESTSFG